VNSFTERKVISRRDFTKNLFSIRFERLDFEFKPGQNILVSIPSFIGNRPYSIYSGAKDPYLEILLKEVPFGRFSIQLKNLQVGDIISISKPFGSFTIGDELAFSKSNNFVFIATSTGISPFHCFIRSHLFNNLQIIHGVRELNDAIDLNDFSLIPYTICSSQDKRATYSGRVTDFLMSSNFLPGTKFYVCGGDEMIDDVYDILKSKGIPKENIQTEGYY